MWGRVLLAEPGVSPDAAEADLVAIIDEMNADAQRLLLLGLLRPRKLLIGGYSAPLHRCCPLTAALWEATGHETTNWDDIVTGINRIGLAQQHQRFSLAYDQWARAWEFERVDRDRLLVLSTEGRLRLVELVERQANVAS